MPLLGVRSLPKKLKLLRPENLFNLTGRHSTKPRPLPAMASECLINEVWLLFSQHTSFIFIEYR
jgi:hypothetical protein